MTAPTLAALPQFLAYLSTFPTPERMLLALRAGPLRQFSTRSSYLWRMNDRDDELIAIANIGHTPQEQERYGVIPIGLDLQVARAVRENQIAADDAAAFGTAYLGAIDVEFAGEMLARISASSVISVPIPHADRIVGALGIINGQPWHGNDESLALLAAIAAALGLWLTHPDADLPDPRRDPSARTRAWSLVLTDRQRQVLVGVENGESTPAIARAVRASESTVKQDLAHAMRILRTTDRRTAAHRARTLGLLG